MRHFVKRLVIFLVRRRLGLKKYEKFQFEEQKTNAEYWFTYSTLLKKENDVTSRASVSLNWLLSDSCKIRRVL